MLNRHENLKDKIEKHAMGIVKEINTILDILTPLWMPVPVPKVIKLYWRLQWHFKKRDRIQLLYTDMELLERSMSLFVGLVNVMDEFML